ncbi:phage portal protein [Romboutsia maritimum]|uniref:Phage portal protein n=1 Tax=Romboutsia maritimum TaxID=2020948 RepID=A0A371IQ42_9FIRM|nr:phage portal protein [Romboutsia maritimum]RDY22595.1 phage portal protein [Romboutsia maritimum]
MELEVIKKLIQNSELQHNKFVKKVKIAERYYKTDNDIKYNKSPSNNQIDNTDNPLRNADNRIPFDWYKFLVNQKTSYALTYPPIFDVFNDKINEQISAVLGDSYPKEAKTLCKNASNCGVAWLHVWLDEKNEFQYSNVDPKQVIPIYSSDLKRKLIAVLRTYDKVDEEGKDYAVYEYWTDKEVYAFSNKKDISVSTGLTQFNMFTQTDLDTGEVEKLNVISHNFGEVPFIEFDNNDLKTSDLDNVKPLIDVYDKVFKRYINRKTGKAYIGT